MESESRDQAEVVIGVVSDTHIPDRVFTLHPDLIPGLQAAGVSLILHSGDISTQSTLDQLKTIAPLEAVRGNRDFLIANNLPIEKRLKVYGVDIYLTHGHGKLIHYLWDKWLYTVVGYKFPRYQRYLAQASDHARVVVFGHTHRAENRQIGETLFFNPGSAGPNYDGSQPSFGLLTIQPDGRAGGEIRFLENYPVRKHRWLKP